MNNTNKLRRFFRRAPLALFVSVSLIASSPGKACTSFLLKAGDGGYVYGRTLEFGIDLKSTATLIPRGFAYQAVGASGQPATGLAWKTKFAAVGVNGLDLPILIDGFNEKGLGGGLLYAPNTALYQDVASADSKGSIASYEMLNYALTNFATVDEARDGFKKIKVNRSPHPVFKGPIPLHMTLHDATGKSIVIEYTKGVLNVFDNPTGVMTNDPTFDWQLANIGQYANLSPKEAQPLRIGGTNFGAPSSGGGLHGIPGDFLSPSRFIRVLAYSQSAPTTGTAEAQVMTAFHILNNFDIPPGAIQLSSSNPYGGGGSGFERTEWMSVSDLKNQVLYLKTFENQHIQALDMKKLNLASKEVKYFELQKVAQVVQLGL